MLAASFVVCARGERKGTADLAVVGREEGRLGDTRCLGLLGRDPAVGV